MEIKELVDDEEGAEVYDTFPYFGYSRSRLSMVVIHGKTDRAEGVGELKYQLPPGRLSKLLLVHIKHGYDALTLEHASGQPRMFMTRDMNAFSDSTFCHYWSSCFGPKSLATEMGVSYFAPSAARKMFVEDYTCANGVSPSMWDGAAVVMGNSVAQWGAVYNPSKRKRQAQASVDSYSKYLSMRGSKRPPGSA